MTDRWVRMWRDAFDAQRRGRLVGAGLSGLVSPVLLIGIEALFGGLRTIADDGSSWWLDVLLIYSMAAALFAGVGVLNAFMLPSVLVAADGSAIRAGRRVIAVSALRGATIESEWTRQRKESVTLRLGDRPGSGFRIRLRNIEGEALPADERAVLLALLERAPIQPPPAADAPGVLRRVVGQLTKEQALGMVQHPPEAATLQLPVA